MKTFTFWLAIAWLSFSGISFAQKPDSVSLYLEKDKLIFPGNALQLGLAFWENGSVRHTKGILGGKAPWRKLYIESSLNGKIYNGLLRIPQDLALVKQKTFTIRVYDRKKKELYAEKTVNYDYPVRVKPQLPDNFTKAPGYEVPFKLTVDWSNGTSTQLQRRAGLISLEDFTFFVEGGAVHKNRLCIAPNPHSFKNHTVALYASARDFAIADVETVSFMLDYKADYSYFRSGHSGFSGSSGSSGSSGGTGCHGQDGQWGGPGQSGDHGPDLRVTADAYYDDLLGTDLIAIEVMNLQSGTVTEYLLNPKGGSLEVVSSGGDGGRGGDGGSGGKGGDGADGKTYTVKKKINDSTYVDETVRGPGHRGGDGGNGGGGGPGGYGGDGGNIQVYFTPAAKPYLSVIRAASRAGSGGWGGSGGSGGSAGSGGAGEPRGSSGSGGSSGPGGPHGGDGRRGQVLFYPLRQ